jgi:peptidoglycan/xylan/chitin deacetylase (PgdA/CDA1 family)
MRKALFAIAVLAPFLAVLLYPRFGIVVALSPIFTSHVLLCYAALTPNCQWWGPVVRSFATSEAELWLTIDDGPSEQTAHILDLLDQQNVRATFFVVGARAEAQPHLITEILTRGHEVANHTFTHPSAWLWLAGPQTIARQLDRCAAILRSTPQRPARFFRAPAGLKSPFLHPVVRARGLQLIGWSARGFDTLRRTPAKIARTITRDARPGSIILLHEGHHHTHVESIAATVQQLHQAGFRFVIPEPSQLLTIPPKDRS